MKTILKFPQFNDRLYKYYLQVTPSSAGEFDLFVEQKVGNEYKTFGSHDTTVSFFDDSLGNYLELAVWMDPVVEYFDFSIRVDILGTLGNLVTIYKSLLLSLLFLAVLSQMRSNHQFDYHLLSSLILPLILQPFRFETLLVGKHDWKSILLLPFMYLLLRQSFYLLCWILLQMRQSILDSFATRLSIVTNRNLRLSYGIFTLVLLILLPPSLLMIPLIIYALLLTIARRKSFELGLLIFTTIFEIPHIISYLHTSYYYSLPYSTFKFIICIIFTLYYLPKKRSTMISFEFLGPLVLLVGWKYCYLVDEICIATMAILMSIY